MSTQEDGTDTGRDEEQADAVKTCNIAMNAAMDKVLGYCDTEEARVDNLARFVALNDTDFDLAEARAATLSAPVDSTLVRQKVVALAADEMDDGTAPGDALNAAWDAVSEEVDAVETPSFEPETPEENEDPVEAPESPVTPPEGVEDAEDSEEASEPVAAQPEPEVSENDPDASENGEDDDDGE